MPTHTIVAGDAIDASPGTATVMPVTDPLMDFPITANQTEAYRFHFVVNNGETMTDCSSCCGSGGQCNYLHIELGYHTDIWKD